MKAALCISGLPRQFISSFRYIKSSILDVIDCDIFSYMWDVKNPPICDPNGPIRYGNEGSLQEFADLYKPVDAIFPEWNSYTESFFNTNDQHKDEATHSIIRFNSLFYTIFKCNELKNKYCLKNDQKYDIVIKCRSDLKIQGQLNFGQFNNSIDNNVVYSNMVNENIVSQILFFGNPLVMDTVCNFYNEIDNFAKNGEKLHFEKTFAKHIYNQAIEPLDHNLLIDVIRPEHVKW